MLEDIIEAVTQFHRQMQLEHTFVRSMPEEKVSTTLLRGCITSMHASAKFAESHSRLQDKGTLKGDIRYLRFALIAEEVAECLEAMLDGDEAEVLDGICDAIYVLVGTALCFDLPLEQAIDLVQASNMTKQPVGPNDSRLRDKGVNFRTPNLKRLIEDYRNGQGMLPLQRYSK